MGVCRRVYVLFRYIATDLRSNKCNTTKRVTALLKILLQIFNFNIKICICIQHL